MSQYRMLWALSVVLLMGALVPMSTSVHAQEEPPSLRLDDQVKSDADADADAEEEEEKKEPLEYNIAEAIVYSNRGEEGVNLYIYDPDQDEPLQLTDDQLIQSFPVFSPNRKAIAFLAMNFSDPEQPRGVSIRVVSADGMKEEVLYEAPSDASIIGLNWSPDSSKLVFAEKRNERVTQEEYNQFVQAHQEKVAELREAHDSSGAEQAFVAPKMDTRQLWKSPKMYSLKVSGSSAPRYIGKGVNPAFVGKNKIIFTHIAPNPDPKQSNMMFQLATISQPGGKPTVVGPLNAVMAAPSPDMSEILFIKVFNGRRTQLWKMDASGENAQLVTNSRGNVAMPSWDVKGEKIIVTREGRGSSGSTVWTMTAEGGDVEKLVEGGTGTMRSQFFIGKTVASEPKAEGEKK